MSKKRIFNLKNEKLNSILSAVTEVLVEPGMDYLVGYIASLERENELLKKTINTNSGVK